MPFFQVVWNMAPHLCVKELYTVVPGRRLTPGHEIIAVSLEWLQRLNHLGLNAFRLAQACVSHSEAVNTARVGCE